MSVVTCRQLPVASYLSPVTCHQLVGSVFERVTCGSVRGSLRPWVCPAGWSDLLNRLESRGNYSAASNNMKLVHWPLMCGLLHLVQRGGEWAGQQPTQAPLRCTKCNSLPINSQCTVLLYNGPLICGFNAGIKGFK